MSPGRRYYSWLLGLLAEPFRVRRASDLLEAYDDMRADLGSQPGFLRLAKFYLRLTRDILCRLHPERRRALRNGQHPARFRGSLPTDFRLSVRALTRRPLFPIVAMVSLCIGVGASTTVFTFLDAALHRAPPSIGEPSRVLEVRKTGTGHPLGFLSYPDFQTVKEEVSALSHVAAVYLQGLSLTEGEGGVRVSAFMVSSDYFPTLQIAPPVLGRYLLPEEDSGTDLHFVAVLSHRLWQDRFGADLDIVGRTVELNRHTFTVVGVTPPDFRGHLLAYQPDIFLPLMQYPVLNGGRDPYDVIDSNWLAVLARMAPGTAKEEVGAALTTLSARFAQEFPATHEHISFGVTQLTSVPSGIRGPVAGFLGGLFGLVILILLITASNLAGVVLARVQERERELAIRLSLGSGRAGLVRQVLLEVLLVFLLGGLLGVALARWTLDLIPLLDLPTPVPLYLELEPHAAVFLFGIGLTLLVGLLFGLLPALKATKVEIARILKGDPAGIGPGVGRLRKILVSTQVGFTVVLALSSVLFLRSLQRAGEVAIGFDPEAVYVTHVDLSMEGYNEADGRALQRRVLDELSRRSSIEEASISAELPMDMGSRSTDFYSPSWAIHWEHGLVSAQYDVVSPGYFRTLGIQLQSGRTFRETDTEDTERICLVSEAFVRRYWPDRQPLGEKFHVHDSGGPLVTVVGVVGDVKPSLITDEATPFVYLPLEQSYQRDFFVSARVLPQIDPASALSELRQTILTIDPKLSLQLLSGLATYTNAGLLPQRAAAWITTPLTILAFLLSGIGIYGIVAQAVLRRRREIGIRMALGARGRSVLALVMSGVGRSVLPGLVIGSIGAILLGKALRGFLLGLGPWDPVALAIVVIAIGGVVGFAVFVPAQKALRMDPVESLREE